MSRLRSPTIMAPGLINLDFFEVIVDSGFEITINITNNRDKDPSPKTVATATQEDQKNNKLTTAITQLTLEKYVTVQYSRLK